MFLTKFKINIVYEPIKVLLVFLWLSFNSCQHEVSDIISLSGEWKVKLDSTNVGDKENWAKNIGVADKIELPGTLDDARIGKSSNLQTALNNRVLSGLNRKYEYYGKAYYQREVDIPKEWENKKINLILERVLWESKLYVDGKEVGSQESLVGSHIYDLSQYLTPGAHRITVRVDNSNKYPNINVLGDRYPDEVDKEMAHAYTNHTQIKWNGILGDIILRASEKSIPNNIQIYPDLGNDQIHVTFEHPLGKIADLQFDITDLEGNTIFSKSIDNINPEDSITKFSIQCPEALKTWDEFSPNLYTAKLINGKGATSTRFGYRTIEHKYKELHLNDHRIYLRGNLECAIFPLTGYPPMEKEKWALLINKAKNYGLNHLRFHSWCPPKAAFEAADEAGFYFQVELPHWSLRVGEDKATTDFLYREAYKILRDYGNHPSFILMSMGNELQGDVALLNFMTKKLKMKDGRHLYATTSFSFQKPVGTRPEPEDEFFITQWTDKGWIRGQGIFNDQSPRFDEDYSEYIENIDIPVISHEIGQYSVYPDLSEIPKYTGVLEPLNFIAVKNDLENKGLLDLATEFTNASGKLASMLYKEEIERALKTEAFDGFQLLQLQDFPGQGTALVGLLNAFWESKGIISGEEFRQFNSEVVPLIRFEKAVYKSGETFKADVEIANFYKDMPEQKISWSISNDEGEVLESGNFSTDLVIGNNKNLATISFPLTFENAQKLSISVKIEDTSFKNSWSIWVYPDLTIENIGKIVITDSFEEAKDALREGKKVFLNPKLEHINGITGRFVPVFWSPVHFPDQPGTMGLLIDEKHNAFDYFPTSKHTEWHWWDLCIQSKSVNLDNTDVVPIVRVIDNFVSNHNLANIVEAKVGKGSLLFTSIDLQTDLENRFVAKQLKYSLLQYMNSNNFHPKQQMDWQGIEHFKQ